MRIYVGNLDRAITDSQLNALVIPFGLPLSSIITRDDRTGESKGFGFVEFATEREGYATIAALNGTEILGQHLKLTEERAAPMAAISNEPRWKP